MKKNFFILFKKYNKEFSNMFKNASELSKCNKTKCKNQFDEFEKYRKIILDKLAKLNIEQTNLIKNLNLNSDKIDNEYRNNTDVIKYIENIRNRIPNDNKLVNSYKKIFKIYQKNKKQHLKVLWKTEEYKTYNKELKNILNELENNIHSLELKKCSFKECLEIHKKGILIVKNFVNKLCKENIKKSCKIYKMIDKLDLTKITYNDNDKLKKLIKRGVY